MGNYTSLPVNLEFFRTAPARSRRDLASIRPSFPRLLAAIAEFERELIKERTGDGRKRAMANGVKFGRKPKLSDYQRQEAIKSRAKGETLASIAKGYAAYVSMISRLT